MTTDILALENATKRYGERTALSGVTFAIHPGEAVGYLGPNGAGKTTTLKLLSGLMRPDAGSIRVLGLDPVADGGRAMAKVGALVETPGLAPYLHGRDLLEYVAEVKGISARDRPGEVRRAAGEMGVSEHLDRGVGGLSTGLVRRLLLAGALVGNPELLLLDEPTLGLDPIARRDLRAILRRLNAEGTTVLLSTHLLDDVEEVCGRVLFLRDGRLVGDEPTHRDPGKVPDSAPRRIRLRFVGPAAVERLTALLGPGEALEDPRGAEVTLVHSGGDVRQAELLAKILRADLALVSARPLGDTLTDRYLAAVGREEA
ncbi:MAG: ABC transporter ATP-binding protein [Thermoplasmata archaeon]|nr:ABC transporter ATP-binding protein [Thermoplasmata archaeon]